DRLLVRKVDAEPDRRRARLAGAEVRRLHDPRPAAGDDRVALLAEPPRERTRGGIAGVGARRAGRAEDRHRLADVGELREAGAQLVLDPEQPLRVRELAVDRVALG